MTEISENQALASRSARRAVIMRLLLRMLPLPFVPGPELYDLIRELRRSRIGLDQKVRQATQALSEASALVGELQNELAERTDLVAKLRAEYEKYEQLAQIEEKKAEALIRQIQATVGSGKGTERLISLGINLLAGLVILMLGIAIGPWVKSLFGIGG